VTAKRGHRPLDLRNATPESRAAFAASLKQRGKAAKGLEQDLLTKVPLLYGSPGSMEPEGDPGIVLARIHQEELLRRNGGGAPPHPRTRSDVALPFERAMLVLPLLLLLLMILLD